MDENTEPRRGLWILGIKPGDGREDLLSSYLETGGYVCRLEQYDNLEAGRPLGIVLDISPFSEDGWGVLLKIKNSPVTRNIPVL
ncbi:MAG TPA: response regulator, partial [Desulfuromonadaceae bacterium]